MTDAASILMLILTLLPGANPEAAREIARHVLVQAGCADVRVELERARPRAPLHVRARCLRLGSPAPGTPESTTS